MSVDLLVLAAGNRPGSTPGFTLTTLKPRVLELQAAFLGPRGRIHMTVSSHPNRGEKRA